MLNIANDIINTNPGSGNTPFGSFKNDAVPGDNSGSPLIEKWPNDIYYALLAVLNRASITPSGVKENTVTSQFLNALLDVIGQENPSNFLRPRPRDTADNRIFLSRGVTRDPNDTIGEPVIIAEDSTAAITHTAVTINGEKRYDRYVHDKIGNVTKIIGTQAVSPVKPAFVEGENPICSVLIKTFGATPVIDNTQDIIEDERVQNLLPFLNIPSVSGDIILSGSTTDLGAIDFNFGAPGVSFSVLKSSAGVYEYTLTGAGAFTKILVLTSLVDHGNARAAAAKGVTDINLDTGKGTTTGFRIRTYQLTDQSGGTLIGEPGARDTPTDFAHQFIVIGL